MTETARDPAGDGSTPSQTVGPYLSIGLDWDDGAYVVPEATAGAFWLRGRLLDGEGAAVPDGLIETWQADPEGRFDHPDDPRGAVRSDAFRGFGRASTDDDGRWAIHTVKPGPVPGDGDTVQAPHLDVSVFARGLLHRLVTRVYFADEDEANAADPVLASLPAPARATLVAAGGPGGYQHEIRLQGDGETVFFRL